MGMEQFIVQNMDSLSTQELANIIYSYHKADNAAKALLRDLMPAVMRRMPQMKPRELVCCLVSYTEEGFFDLVEEAKDSLLIEGPAEEAGARAREEHALAKDDQDGLASCQNAELLREFQEQLRGKYEAMNPEDLSKAYYCFTKAGAGFVGHGRLYKYLQKAITKTIKQFDSGNLRHMFIRFDELEKSRLNRGVRGRLVDRVKDLMDKKQMKGYDVQYIYEQTADLKHEADPESGKKSEIHFVCRLYLQKVRYFT